VIACGIRGICGNVCDVCGMWARTAQWTIHFADDMFSLPHFHFPGFGDARRQNTRLTHLADELRLRVGRPFAEGGRQQNDAFVGPPLEANRMFSGWVGIVQCGASKDRKSRSRGLAAPGAGHARTRARPAGRETSRSPLNKKKLLRKKHLLVSTQCTRRRSCVCVGKSRSRRVNHNEQTRVWRRNWCLCRVVATLP
jgi:hypothetical protein